MPSDPTQELRVLVLEDSEDDLLLILRALQRGGYSLDHSCVQTRSQFLETLAQGGWDLILADYRMPNFSGSEALALVRATGLDIPFFIISGAVGEEAAVELMRAGARDFVRKDKLDRLIPAIQRELKEVQVRRERRQAEAAFRESEEKIRRLVNSSPDAILFLDSEGRIQAMNPATETIWGLSPAECLGRKLTETGVIAVHDCPVVDENLAHTLRDDANLHNEMTTLSRDGVEVFMEAVWTPIRHEGRAVGVNLTMRNVSEKRRLEEQLRLAQKMEAIGQLAGGVAHDFNNQLSGIIGCAEILHTEIRHNPQLAWYATTILTAAERAAGLTRQLLAFARKNKYQTIPVSLHHVIVEVISLLQHTLDPRIEIRQDLLAAKDLVLGDPSQLQNAVLNLAVNARDAMPSGGRLTFRTSLETFSGETRGYCTGNLEAGVYVRLTVEDTGTGIPTDILPHVFEPFFTTKERGKGTGLGLAAVYGIVTGHRGAIEVQSEMGKGTSFSLLLPVHTREDSAKASTANADQVAGSGRILVIDDEEIVRCIAERMLQNLGYQVYTCANGAEAIEFFRQHSKEVDVILLDMIMPKMNGRDTFFALKQINPRLKVVLSTGHAFGTEIQELLSGGVLGLLQKPFRISELSRAIADAIQAAPEHGPG